MQPGRAARALISAIEELNPEAQVSDQGGYLRVSVRGRCVVTREAIEAHLGQAFVLPGDLEVVMPAFSGKLTVSDERAEWASEGKS